MLFPQNQFILLSVGVLRIIKRFDLVIRALHKIKKKNPELNIKYFLIGEGEQHSYLKELSKDLKLNNEVEFLGKCNMTMRNKYYKLSDVFIMPSISTKSNIEGFGITFIEANYYKLPVIGTRSGGIPSVIKDGVNGLLIEQNNIDELVEKILFLYFHEEIRKQMGEEGHKRVVEHYTWDKIINEYLNIFKKLY
jgi:phosphatidylinositol alpha-1,6-mannosyltransferase